MPQQQQLQLENVVNGYTQEDYLTKQIVTYLGNKRSLLPLIDYAIKLTSKELGTDQLSFFDVFSGSGIVSRLFKTKANFLMSNDLEPYAEIINRCYLSTYTNEFWDELVASYQQLTQLIEKEWVSDGFIAELYAPKDDNNIMKGERTFYTRRNAEYLDTARSAIAQLPSSRQVYFLAPLLSSASIHVNTSGVFKGFYKDANGIGCFGGRGKNALPRILGNIEVELPTLSSHECEVSVTRLEARDAIRNAPHVNLAYFDPPYNQHPYGSNYFMLNLLTNYERPQDISAVSGIPKEWNRSNFNKKAKAKTELFQIIEKCDADFILVSYNSEGFIEYNDFITFMSALGDLRVIETDYNTFRGSRNLRQRDIHVKEYLFLLRRN